MIPEGGIFVDKEKSIKLFEEKTIRTHWDEDAEKWYFSVVDVVSVLTDSVDPAAYWRKLKQRLIAEGNETVTNCHGLKMRATDGMSKFVETAYYETRHRLPWSVFQTGDIF
ncbi:hypothetical protein FACS189475_09560 [Betaproteobacteria bacterium]|nr:hypothetical protein FACS189475_09560 [Betaproteobacteria bacterium]